MAADLNAEQPPPGPCSGPDCWELVLADMAERRRIGIARYGVPVRPDNGRDALVDAYQEALDLCVYLRQAIEQRDRAELARREESARRLDGDAASG